MSTSQGYAHKSPVKRPEWHSLIAWDMFFNNLTTGLFLVAAICDVSWPHLFHESARWAFPIALVCLIIDLICLVLDLGDPLRFHHMLRVFKPSSPMSLGTWCLTIYSLPLTLVVGIDLLPPGWSGGLMGLRLICLVGGILPAFGSAVYKGVLISTSSQPGWKNARWLGGYLANSALVFGAASLMLISLATGPVAATNRLRTITGILLVINLVPLSLLISDVAPALLGMRTRKRWWITAANWSYVGLLIPLQLLAMGKGWGPVVLATAMIFSVNLYIRFVIVKLPHSEP